MLVLSQAHSRRINELSSKLDACTGVSQVADCVCDWIDDIAAGYMSQADFVYSRQMTYSLTDSAKQAVRLMGAVNKAMWRYVPTQDRKTGINKKDVVKYSPAALMLITAIVCLFCSQTVAACLSIVAAAINVVALSFVKEKPPVEAECNINKDDVIAGVGRLFEVIEAKLAESVNEVIVDAPRLTRSVIEGIQMLMEAKITKDGDYALKSVPQLADSLRRQGVTLEMYLPGTEKDFDLLPSLTGGDTIRPAVRQGEKLLLRGQATVIVKQQLEKGEKA